MDDLAIAQQVLAGDTQAFEHLVHRHKDHVARIVAGKVPAQAAEEVAQDAFVRAFTSLSSWRSDAPFQHWLARITVRACHDYWRREYRNRETPASALGEVGRDWLAGVESGGDFSGRPINDLDAYEAKQVLDWALDRLSPSDRMVLTLTYLEEKSVRETAELMGITRANVKVRAHRARRKLAVLLREQGAGEDCHEE